MIKIKNILLLMACACTSLGYAQQITDTTSQVADVNKQAVNEKRATGTVLDAVTGKPLDGISISVPGVSAAMTDEKGKFTIKVPSFDVELLIFGPGYQNKRIALKGNNNIQVRLNDETAGSVYENVMTPLGEMSGNHATVAMTQLKGDNSLSVATTPDVLMQGKVAGLNAVSRSGMEGAGMNMFMRGFNSIYTNNQPLLIIDGMVVENMSAGVSLIDGYLSTPLNTIDVKDIERITVLRDAAVLYGVKGANGAIVIETKRSQAPETRIKVQALMGMNMKPSEIPLLNASQAKRYMADVYQSRGYSNSEIQNLPFLNTTKPTLEKWGYDGNVDYYRYNKSTNWQDKLFTEGFKQDYSLSVTGGDEIAVYAVSLGYLQNEGVVSGTDYSRFSARLNTDINFSQRLKVNTSMSFVYGKKNLAQEGSLNVLNPIYSSLVKAPFTTSQIYDELDQMSPNYEDVDFFGMANPQAVIDNVTQENSNYGFVGNVNVKYNVWKNLTLSTLFGLRFNKERERIFHPSVGIPYGELPTALITNQLQHRVERIFSLFDETRANYLFKFNNQHQLDATIGMRYMNTKGEDDWGKGYNSASDDFTSINYGLNELRQAGGSIGTWNWLAFYANVAYSFKDKYFLTATASFDASSRYGEDISQFQAFPSVSASWLISSEKFMRDAAWVDMLKLRASYSMSGNDDIGNFTARRYYVPQNLMGNYGLVRGNLVNSALKPERIGKMDIGVDAALFNERLSFSVDFYKSKVKDMIAYSSVTPLSGFSTYVDNNGEMENTGLDFSLNARLINNQSLKWDLGMTVSHYKNKVTKLQGDTYITEIANANILTQVGKPLGVFYGYKTDGVYATSADAKADNLYVRSGLLDLPFEAGDVRFMNMNDDKYINEEDMVEIGDPNPDVFGGITTRLQWKNFTFSAQFNYSIGNDIYNYTRRTLESMSGTANQTQAVLNRWKVEGQITNMPKVTYGDPMQNSRFSGRWIEDGSYFKFKNLTLAYDIPIRKGVLTGLQVYAVAENLCTWTSYKGYDPEFSVTSSPLGAGIDAFVTPQTRTFYVGLKLGL